MDSWWILGGFQNHLKRTFSKFTFRRAKNSPIEAPKNSPAKFFDRANGFSNPKIHFRSPQSASEARSGARKHQARVWGLEKAPKPPCPGPMGPVGRFLRVTEPYRASRSPQGAPRGPHTGPPRGSPGAPSGPPNRPSTWPALGGGRGPLRGPRIRLPSDC